MDGAQRGHGKDLFCFRLGLSRRVKVMRREFGGFNYGYTRIRDEDEDAVGPVCDILFNKRMGDKRNGEVLGKGI